ncbi:MAG: phage holin family protein [Candidatus Promineifilaceae bacterium]|nr:phage holin family protein [Candidatus Promineifilaceae bacterium]
MFRILLRWAINAIALWAAVQIVPGLEHQAESGLSLLIIALIFGLVNALIRPIVILLTCPLILLTMGLFILVINTIMLSLTVWLSDVLELGLSSNSFWTTFFGAVVISVVSGLINLLVKDKREEERGEIVL